MSPDEYKSFKRLVQRRSLRVAARAAMVEFIHTVENDPTDGRRENSDRILLAHMFGFDNYMRYGKGFTNHHNKVDDSSKIDQVLTAIINHGKAGFLMYWYQNDNNQ